MQRRPHGVALRRGRRPLDAARPHPRGRAGAATARRDPGDRSRWRAQHPDVPGPGGIRRGRLPLEPPRLRSRLGRQEGRRGRGLQQWPRHRPGPLRSGRRGDHGAALVDVHHRARSTASPRSSGPTSPRTDRPPSTPTCSPAPTPGRCCSRPRSPRPSRRPGTMPSCWRPWTPSGSSATTGPAAPG